jgi:hypothetical protein
MYSKSTDGGQNWTVPARIGESIQGSVITGARLGVAVAPSLAIAPDGTVGVAFYDHRYDKDTCNSPLTTDLWLRYSRDGGRTWKEDHLTGPFDQGSAPVQTSGPFIGDYQGIAPIPGGFANIFTLTDRTSNTGQRLSYPPTDVYFAKVNLDMPAAGVVSRKVHGGGGTFDIDLTGGNGIECRSGGETGDYILVFSFPNPLTSVYSASVTSGSGTVSSSAIDSSDAHQYIVNLTGVANAQYLTVALNGVVDVAANIGDVSGTMGVLVGDVNASRRVDAADVSSVRQQTLQSVTTSNFCNDINASGRIDAADVSIARQQTLTSLP